MKYRIALPSIAAAFLLSGAAPAQSPDILVSLQGTWEMVSAYEVTADGARTTNYGEHPLGLLTVDAAHRYNMQIFKVGRPAFASGDKARGTPDEYRQAVVGSSTHFGTVMIDAARHQLVFEVKAASFPNWEGRRQVRDYAFRNGLLSYAVPASASGSGLVAHSIWRRVGP